jgi:hypothetical protein
VVSGTLAPGYGAPPEFAYDAAIAKKAADLGWEATGSAGPVRFWTPGSGWPGGCTAGEHAGWYDCTIRDVSGRERSGRVQTFSRAPDDGGEGAIFAQPGREAVFMSRGVLGPFTNPWDGERHDGLYYLGFPLADSRPVAGGVYRMDFENGYAIYDPGHCGEKPTAFYVWFELLHTYLEMTPGGAYCDSPLP